MKVLNVMTGEVEEIEGGEAASLRPEDLRAHMRVARLQLRVALAARGALEKADKAINGGLMAAGAGVAVRMIWAEAPEFGRVSPTVDAVAAALGLTEDDVDALFNEAAAVVI